ncbi:signal peptidase II [Alkalicaulis satelles]|uniref:Lipoprotein signal peptidase n=2 Tax=Alkalicaulis satelles TaxID=2609175 RepID=A0A5M6ZH92_9PROT|nr:signal peptidase II [Alkalicaulis satelles]
MFARRRRLPAPALAGLLSALAILAADQASKAWILYRSGLPEVQQIPVIDPWFNLTMVWNAGISFGLFAADSLWQRLILVGISLAVAGVLAVWMWRSERALQACAFGLIIGGAVGNVIDRLAYGAVADFLDFSGLYFPWVFNVADAAISIGVAVMLADLVFNERRR